MLLWISVALIGGFGAVARHTVDSTLAVNMSGALLLGVLSGLDLGHDSALLAGTALLGSYTTFSTWMLEANRLPARRMWVQVCLVLVAGLALAALGRVIGGALE
jgi:fluoride exporter